MMHVNQCTVPPNYVFAQLLFLVLFAHSWRPVEESCCIHDIGTDVLRTVDKNIC